MQSWWNKSNQWCVMNWTEAREILANICIDTYVSLSSSALNFYIIKIHNLCNCFLKWNEISSRAKTTISNTTNSNRYLLRGIHGSSGAFLNFRVFWMCLIDDCPKRICQFTIVELRIYLYIELNLESRKQWIENEWWE